MSFWCSMDMTSPSTREYPIPSLLQISDPFTEVVLKGKNTNNRDLSAFTLRCVSVSLLWKAGVQRSAYSYYKTKQRNLQDVWRQFGFRGTTTAKILIVKQPRWFFRMCVVPPPTHTHLHCSSTLCWSFCVFLRFNPLLTYFLTTPWVWALICFLSPGNTRI